MRIAQLLFLLIILPSLAFGQNVIADRVQKAGTKAPKAAFSIVDRAPASLKSVGVDEAFLEQGIIVDLNDKAISDLQKAAPDVLGMTFPLPGIGDVNMTLIPNKL
jgi:hypothetical protein